MTGGELLVKRFCDRCGASAAVQALFCKGCGASLEAGYANVVGEAPQGGAEGAVGEVAAAGMDLGTGWMVYLVAIIFWLAVLVLAPKSVGFLIPITHLGLGFVMVRYVMGQLIEFHPVHNTISNVFSAKIGMFFFWPISMPILLFKLSVNAVL